MQISHPSFNQDYQINLSDIYWTWDMEKKRVYYACKTNYSSEKSKNEKEKEN